MWCRDNNLLLNTNKTKELVVDFRKKRHDIQPLHFLGVTISDNLTWGQHIAELVGKAQKRLCFLRVRKKNNIVEKLLVSYCSTVESVLSYFLCAWYSSCTVAQRKELQRIIRTAQRIVGGSLLPLEDCTTPTASRVLPGSSETLLTPDTDCSNVCPLANNSDP